MTAYGTTTEDSEKTFYSSQALGTRIFSDVDDLEVMDEPSPLIAKDACF